VKVYVFPADLYGCGYYRLIWPAEQLKASGHDVVIVSPKQRGSHLKAATNQQGQIIDVNYPRDADVIVLQRITHSKLIDAIKIMRSRGVAIVIDMDDDLAAINPNNPAFRAMHPTMGLSREHNWKNTQLACEAASWVTVSTPALWRRYAPHERGTVLENRVPESYLKIERTDSDIVGWGGSTHSHPNDLQTMGPAIAALVREGVRFRLVGPGDGAREALGLDREPESTGPRDMHTEWMPALAELGIGVAPLEDTRFNAGKSWLKPLEYAAVGVVPVMSPRDEYRALNALGIGLLASKPRQWVTHVRALVRDPIMRRDMSQHARAMAALFTVENGAHLWWQAWEDAYRVERAS
jgi:hypothetical protein